MTRLHNTASAAIAALILAAGATTASAQSFSNAGENVTARGTLEQNVQNPGGPDLTTNCSLEVYGQVASDGSSITFTSYEGVAIDSGPLACDDSLDFPIVVTALDFSTVNLSQFVVGTRNGPCAEDDYVLAYSGNEVIFDGAPFGAFGICSAAGALALTSDVNSDPILIQ